MRRRTFQSVHFLMPAVLLAIVAGCDSKPAAETGTAVEARTDNQAPTRAAASVLGKYENANDKIIIELKADGKCTMTDEGKSTDVTWEMDGADKLVVHGQEGMNLLLKINSDGNLSDNMGLGSVFRKK